MRRPRRAGPSTPAHPAPPLPPPPDTRSAGATGSMAAPGALLLSRLPQSSGRSLPPFRHPPGAYANLNTSPDPGGLRTMLALVQTLYTAEVTATNGRNGHVRSSDGSVDLDLSAPPALGGTAKPAANPEQLFAAGYSACFIGAMQYQAMQQKLRPGDISIDAKVSIGPAEGDNGFTLAVALDVHVAALDQAAAEKLVADAHRTCPYSNATRGNILVKLTAHGSS